MKSRMSIVISVIIVLAIICVVYCKSDKDIPTPTPEIEEESNSEYGEREIGIYAINNETQECEPAVIVVPEGKKVTEKYIVDEVIANFGGQVKVNDVIKSNNDITVVFEAGCPPSCNVSEVMEELMLNCISFSLIDNISDCKNVMFRIEDKAYEGVSISLAIDEPYISSDISEDEDE